MDALVTCLFFELVTLQLFILDSLLKCPVGILQIACLRLQVVGLLCQLSVFVLFTVQSLLEISFFLQGPVPILKCLFPDLKILLPLLHCLLPFPNGHAEIQAACQFGGKDVK